MSINTDGVEDSPVNAIVDLPNDTKAFEAGGNKYVVSEEIKVGRYKRYQKMEIELGFTLSFPVLVNGLVNAYTALNDRRDADAAVAIKQVLEGVTLIQDKESTALYVATLFINREGEDTSEWSKELAESKIKDWRNINANFFLGKALSFVRSFPQKYNEIAMLMSRVSDVKERMENIGD